MKGMITKQGELVIERAGKMKMQFCPFVKEQVPCGDECPLFGEPYTDKLLFEDGVHEATCLSLCGNRTLNFREFTDDRGEAVK